MLKTRLITSLILIITIGAAFVCLPQLYWGLLMLMIALLASWEWANMSKLNKSASIAYTASIGLFGLWLLLLNPQLIQLIVFWSVFAAVLFWLIVAPILLGFNILISNRVVMALLGLVIIIPFALSMIALREINPILLVVVAMTVWIADTAPYFAGKRFGKRKLAPSISPGKTWEGVMGALVATTAFSFLLSYLTNQSYWFVLVFWGVMVLSILGDLFESLIKRQAGVKDSGNLLPGHGGVLDRIDGLTSSLPLVMFLLTLPIYYNLYLYLKAVVFNA